MANANRPTIEQRLAELEATLQRLRKELNAALDGVADLRRAVGPSTPPPERTSAPGALAAPHADDGAGTLNAQAPIRSKSLGEFWYTHPETPSTAAEEPLADLDAFGPDDAVPPNDGADNGEFDKQIPPLRSASAPDLIDEQSDDHQP